jgi:hypothetical protein
VRLLALLLARPGVSVHCLDLIAAVDGTSTAASGAARAGDRETVRPAPQGGAGPVLDAEAKDAYRRRISELEAEIADARRVSDAQRAERAEGERRFIARELERAVGLGGRDRQNGSHAERARVNVTRAIRSTLKKIAGYDDRLGAELQATVHTGAYCVFAPDPLRPRRWQVVDRPQR